MVFFLAKGDLFCVQVAAHRLTQPPHDAALGLEQFWQVCLKRFFAYCFDLTRIGLIPLRVALQIVSFSGIDAPPGLLLDVCASFSRVFVVLNRFASRCTAIEFMDLRSQYGAAATEISWTAVSPTARCLLML
jgi:hypothetical protein